MNYHQTMRGNVVLLVALTVPVVLGGLGLAVDNGYLYKVKRDTQAIADATAFAAAQEIRLGHDDQLDSVALEDAELNGVKAGDGTTVSIHRPPTGGREAGNSNFVEVVVRREAPLFFLKTMGSATATVESRSVAGVVPGGGACFVSRNPRRLKSLDVNGPVNVVLNNCGVHVGSSHNNAAQINTGTATFTASFIHVVGHASSGPWKPKPEENMPEMADPLADLAPPAYGGCDHEGEYTVDGVETLDAGVFCGGLKVTGHATLRAGTYVLAGGGLIVANDGHIEGEGITFYNTESKDYAYKGIEFSGSSEAHLVAPTAGPLKGVLVFQDRDDYDSGEKIEFSDHASADLSGVIYAPDTPVLFTDDSYVGPKNTIFIADTFEFNDRATINMTLEADNTAMPLALLNARLVE